MEEKKKILLILKSSNLISYDDIKRFLTSDDKDIKHEAWNYVLSNISRFSKDFLYELLRFPDTGTRYRVWNSVPELIQKNLISIDEARKYKEYFIELLKDTNYVVRMLSWYVTLKPILELGVIKYDDVYNNSKYFCEILTLYEQLEEVRQELKINC